MLCYTLLIGISHWHSRPELVGDIIDRYENAKTVKAVGNRPPRRRCSLGTQVWSRYSETSSSKFDSRHEAPIHKSAIGRKLIQWTIKLHVITSGGTDGIGDIAICSVRTREECCGMPFGTIPEQAERCKVFQTGSIA